MLLDGLRTSKILCKEQGEFSLMWAVPKKNNPLGVFSVLKDTKWEVLIGKVTGENLSHALHGWATPLVRELPPAPKYLMKKLKPKEFCRLHDAGCIIADKNCYPCVDVPDCYEPNEDEDKRLVINRIILALKSGIRVVTIVGEEFSL